MAEKRKLGSEVHSESRDCGINNSQSDASLEITSLCNLQHCVFKWTIENYIFCCCGDVLKSPLFTSGQPSPTRWCLELEFDRKVETMSFLSLLRHELDDSSTARFFVNCRFTLQTLENEILFEASFEHTFSPGSSNGVRIDQGEMERLVSLGSSESDVLLILCEIFFQPCESAPEKSPGVQTDDNFLQLSNDYLEFYSKEEDCDLYLRVADGEISAHKAFLVARSSYFADYFSKEKGNIIHFPDLKSELLKKILLYIYSGVFIVSGLKRSELFTLCSYAERFELHLLKELLAPVKAEACTVIKVDYCEFTWTIRDFAFHEGQSIKLKSPVFSCGDPLVTESWHLTLGLKRRKDPSYIAIKLRVSGVKRKIFVSSEMSILTTAPLSSDTVRLVRVIKEDDAMSFHRFLDKNKIDELRQSIIPDDVLKIRCVLRISDMTARREVLQNLVIHFPIDNFEDKSLRKLSKDFYNFQDAPEFYDIELKSGDKKFVAHKPVLLARWPQFRKKFSQHLEQKRSNTFYFNDVPSYAMKKIIIYLYSGLMDNMYPYGAIDIYLAAEKLNIPSIKSICSLYLRFNLNVNIVGNALVLAHTVSDRELQSVVMDYIRLHSEDVFATSEWENISKEWPDLSDKVLEDIKSRHCE